jgi:hypothetical protein
MKDLIIQKQLERIRANERKQTFEIGQTINFKWWDLYGSGKATRKIIAKTPKGKPVVKFQSGNWVIEWNEILNISN